ncbi:glycosyltransferase family 4 protein [Salinibacterium sp. NK8237]|uniref:glycosyltransferase family 4 protein n=1 Tax=Salinibacterium sp. NK8237 TaxID=2792038 RepID=UPI0018CD1594|nr:glycosyltransferase family 4 protein [Salinibacterium sp. NK8237]MBH0129637.1 glycosyltransferase family 4 protein [Salinibacterium sp. NK8237]
MRVLVVTPWYPSEATPGAGVFTLRDVELLRKEHDVRVLHLVAPGASLVGPVPGDSGGSPVERVHFHFSRPDRYRGAVRKIREAVESADIVHTMAFPALFPVARAQVDTPWVHTEHWSGLVTDPPSWHAGVAMKYLRKDLALPNAAVAVGVGLADAMDRCREVPTTVIGNRVHLPAGDRLPSAIPQHASEPIRLVGVGGLVAHKGPLEALDAVAELESRGVPATLHWAGAGSLESEMRARATSLGIADKLTLLGHVDPAALGEVLLNAHVFVLPTAGETFGVAIAEALGHGLPVVTSGSGGHLQFLPAHASRLAARTGPAIAAAVLALRDDPERWSAGQIHTAAVSLFSEDARAEAYRAVYEKALTARR